MGAADYETPKKSTRVREQTRAPIEAWVAKQIPDATDVVVPEIDSPSGTGMSSETLLFELQLSQGGERKTWPLVARLAPDQADCPIFPTYDLEGQFRLLSLIAEHGSLPVPRMRWLEPGTGTIGAPFFVMDRVDGRVPPDIPPYVFAGWVFDASPEERATLQDETVGAIAALHAIDREAAGTAFLEFPLPGDTPMRRHFENQRRFYDWVKADGHSHPVLESAFAWLEDRWPKDEGEAVISWGDSRIGNVLYDGFRPAALLDWEMAAIGPRELDLGWLAFMHRFFQDIAVGAGLPGLPDFLRLEDVATSYERASGHTPRDLDFYFTYAALRHGIIMARIHRRMVHFGQSEWSDDPDGMIPHRDALKGMIDGSFWS